MLSYSDSYFRQACRPSCPLLLHLLSGAAIYYCMLPVGSRPTYISDSNIFLCVFLYDLMIAVTTRFQDVGLI